MLDAACKKLERCEYQLLKVRYQINNKAIMNTKYNIKIATLTEKMYDREIKQLEQTQTAKSVKPKTQTQRKAAPCETVMVVDTPAVPCEECEEQPFPGYEEAEEDRILNNILLLDTHCFSIGKYKDKMFKHVYDTDPKYCRLVRNTKNTNYSMLLFNRYVEERVNQEI